VSLTGVVEVPPRDREVLQGWMRSPSIRAGLAQRARIVLLAADGVGTGEIASRVGTSKQTVISWKHRYRDESLGGLDDRPKPGRPQVIDEAQIVVATLEAPPAHLGVDALVEPAAGRRARPVPRHDRKGLAQVEPAAVALGDV